MEETKAPKNNRFLKGRQIAWMKVSLKGDNVQGFDTKWDETLLLQKNPMRNFSKYVQAAAWEF